MNNMTPSFQSTSSLPDQFSPITSKPRSARRYLPLAAILVVGVAGLGLASVMQLVMKPPSEGRVAAVANNGTATLVLQPAAQTFQPGQVASIQVVMNAGQSAVDGLQIVANLAGQLPADLQFVPAAPVGLETVSNEVVQSTTQPQFKLAMVTQNPEQGFVAPNQNVPVGSFTFTTPASGTFQISFDPSLTRVVQHSVAADILKMPAIGQYQFGSSTPSVSPVASVVPSVVPSPTPRVSPSPTSGVPTVSAKPVPSPSAIVVSPSPMPSPTSQPGGTLQVVVARLREWPYGWNQLTVQVKSDLLPPTTIEVVGFGKLNYNRRAKTYNGTFFTTKKPTELTIKSSTGLQITTPVEIRRK